MTAGIKTGSVITEIGPGAILHGLFSSISVNLEPNGWGSRFPLLMNHLYQGELPSSETKAALIETAIITNELSRIPTSKMVWDIDNHSLKPPPEYTANIEATSLATYFRTTTGRDLLFEIKDSLESAVEFGDPVLIISYNSPADFFRH